MAAACGMWHELSVCRLRALIMQQSKQSQRLRECERVCVFLVCVYVVCVCVYVVCAGVKCLMLI